MIGVHIMGGLGNQLFEYATARALSLRLGVELYLDLSAYIDHVDRRIYLLDKLNIAPPPPRN